jgi:hypothetical protein
VPWERTRLRATRAVVDAHGLTVTDGPFAEMRYVQRALGRVENLVPRLLGSYELELHDAVEQIISGGYRSVVNIGSADGYYAVGIALRSSGSNVYAFDPDPVARSLCSEIATANGVADRVHVEPGCDVARLRALAPGHAVVVCDCEGCEQATLRPQSVPWLATAKVVVELHGPRPEAVLERFARTHELRLIEQRADAAPGCYPVLSDLTEREARLVAREVRPEPARWAILTPL